MVVMWDDAYENKLKKSFVSDHTWVAVSDTSRKVRVACVEFIKLFRPPLGRPWIREGFSVISKYSLLSRRCFDRPALQEKNRSWSETFLRSGLKIIGDVSLVLAKKRIEFTISIIPSRKKNDNCAILNFFHISLYTLHILQPRDLFTGRHKNHPSYTQPKWYY